MLAKPFPFYPRPLHGWVEGLIISTQRESGEQTLTQIQTKSTTIPISEIIAVTVHAKLGCLT